MNNNQDKSLSLATQDGKKADELRALMGKMLNLAEVHTVAERVTFNNNVDIFREKTDFAKYKNMYCAEFDKDEKGDFLWAKSGKYKSYSEFFTEKFGKSSSTLSYVRQIGKYINDEGTGTIFDKPKDCKKDFSFHNLAVIVDSKNLYTGERKDKKPKMIAHMSIETDENGNPVFETGFDENGAPYSKVKYKLGEMTELIFELCHHGIITPDLDEKTLKEKLSYNYVATVYGIRAEKPEQGEIGKGKDTKPEQGKDTKPEQGKDTKPEQGKDTKLEQGKDTKTEHTLTFTIFEWEQIRDIIAKTVASGAKVNKMILDKFEIKE